jgi:hypothetical protein
MATTPNPEIMQAVERLNYRVTVGDVAAQAGLKVSFAEQGLLALASEAGGHLQVAESGEIAYLFPKDFRTILRNKYFQLQLKEWWDKVWRVLFYLIRVSFGIVLMVSIALILISIIIIAIAASAATQSDDRDGDSGFSMPMIGFPDFWWIFYPDYSSRHYEYRDSPRPREKSSLNFLEAIFSFLFGDGDPNADLDERRWQAIATVIRNNRGAVVAEQLAPYLDELGAGYALEYEEYMLPVLTRFNGRPEVSLEGGLVYQFPDLQTTATQERFKPIAAYLKELPQRFSQATGGQVTMAVGLGAVNLIGAMVLGRMLAGGAIAAQIGGLVAFVGSIYWILLAYGIGFLTLPLIRYFWIQWRNQKINARNEQRQARAMQLNAANPDLKKKIDYAQQFAAETFINEEDLAYTTERDAIEQDIEHADQIDAEWRKRLGDRQ